jgi:phospholipase C
MRGLHAIGPASLLALASILGACSAGSFSQGAPSQIPAARMHSAAVAGLDKVKHVVIIIQENRSFDNLFYGFPGADTQSYGYNEQGDKIALQPVGLATSWDIAHNSTSFFAACDGTGKIPGTQCKMDGFDAEKSFCGSNCPNANPPYSYVPHSETAPYFAMAKQYVLADEMFTSNFDGSSFISHQYIIAAQAMRAFNYADDGWGCSTGPENKIGTLNADRGSSGKMIRACFQDTSLGAELDNAGISWRYYASKLGSSGGIWSAYQANYDVYYGPDWSKNIVTPQTQFFTDVSDGTLPAVSWITPTCANSDHAGCDSDTGPSWVTSLVNAIGESKYWDSTVIFIFWDDYGGWYDHVPPEYVDYDGLGIRVPMIMISPYAHKGVVTHVHFEHGSILKFIETRWGLPALSASDARATSPAPYAFDFTQTPRTFEKISAKYSKAYFLKQPLDLRPPDSE